MNDEKKPTLVPLDSPICDSVDDVLGRKDVAESFVENVLQLDISHGATVGVFGAWGSGKTSFINLARQELKGRGIPVLDFNPWMFSGAEQLVERFFAELSSEMEETKELLELGQMLRKYGDALSTTINTLSSIVGIPAVGALIDAGMKIATKDCLQRGNVGQLRKELASSLEKRDKPIIVLLDDIDRLSAPEIRDMFKLVRLTANFPRVIYVVACDRAQVERALDDQGISGHDYLKKIIQLPFDLPEIPNERFDKQLGTALDAAVDGLEDRGPFDRQVWEDVYWEMVRPLIRNIRDIRRYVAAVRMTLVSLRGQVALADVLGLEAVRIFLPDVFRLLPQTATALTVTSVGPANQRHIRSQRETRAGISAKPDVRFKKELGELIETAETHDAVVRAMVIRLFPTGRKYIPDDDSGRHVAPDESSDGQEWAAKKLQERRVVHEHILRLYLERVAGGDLQALYNAETALDNMTDEDALAEFLHSLNETQFVAVLDQLRTFEGRFDTDDVEPGITVLLNLLPDMPKQSSGSMHDEPQLFVGLVITTLLDTLGKSAAVENAARRILPSISSLSSKVLLIDRMRHPRQGEQPLVLKTATTRFARQLRKEILGTDVDDLVDERDLLRVLGFAKSTSDPSEDPIVIPDSPKLTLFLLRSADLQTLRLLYGDEAIMRARFEGLRQQFNDLKPWIESKGITPEEAKQLLETAGNYQAELRKTTFPLPTPSNS